MDVFNEAHTSVRRMIMNVFFFLYFKILKNAH